MPIIIEFLRDTGCFATAKFEYFIELNLDCVVIVDEDGLRAINDQTLTLLKTRKREDG